MHHARKMNRNRIRAAWVAALVTLLTVTVGVVAATPRPAGAHAAPLRSDLPQSPQSPLGLGHPHSVTYDGYSLMIDGKRTFLWSGEFAYWRLPSPSLWRDVLEKLKAAGFNAVSIYFDWDYHSPAPGVYDFNGIRDVNELLDMAAQVGLYVIARPGPFVHAETDGGGLPGWLTRFKTAPRTSDPGYMHYALQWWDKINAILARHQLTNGTGPVILEQVENELTSSSDAQTMMQQLEQALRADGITVPTTINETGWATGTGAVNIDGTADEYPLLFDCNAPRAWKSTSPPTLKRAAANEPIMTFEYQSGSIDTWGGTGYGACRKMANSAFENIYYKNALGQGETGINFYMAYGGINWGWLPSTGIDSSYDYAAPLDEARRLMPTYDEMKRIAYFVDAVAPLRKTDAASDSSPSDPEITELERANPDTGTHFYVLAHKAADSLADSTTTISVNTKDGSYPTVPQQSGTSIELNGRDSKLLLADYDFAAAHLVYSTSELMTEAAGAADAVVLYGTAGQAGETVLRYPAQPQVDVLQGAATSTWDAATGDLRLNYVHGGLIRVRVTSARGTLVLLIADYPASARFWRQSTPGGAVLVRGPYLVRGADVRGDTVALTGDTDRASALEVFPPAGITRVTWNGRALRTRQTDSGSLLSHLAAAPPVVLPRLNHWRFKYETDEAQPGFDDSAWTAADHMTTNNPNAPKTLPVLYADDYGYHFGSIWYRGHFTASGSETGVQLDGEGGGAGSALINFKSAAVTAGMYWVWLNGTFLGSQSSGNGVFTFPPGTLKAGQDNVISVLVMNMGRDECRPSCGQFYYARGLAGAALLGGTTPPSLSGTSPVETAISWKVQGDQGGENIADMVRGPLNNGGLYGERNGWTLPGFDDSGWQSVGLPYNWQSAGGLPPGIAWYRDTFRLRLPRGTDVPIGLQFPDTPAINPGVPGQTNASAGDTPSGETTPVPPPHYRALIFLNGWMMGVYDSDLGPQTRFYLPAGILDPNGANTLAIAVLTKDATSSGLQPVKLVSYGAYAGGPAVVMNASH